MVLYNIVLKQKQPKSHPQTNFIHIQNNKGDGKSKTVFKVRSLCCFLKPISVEEQNI